jgi:serine/threonine protein phosphatase PrpC
MASNQEDVEKAEDFLISTAEAMNPRRRSTMEDCHTILRPGGWDTPIPNLTFMGLYDGHGGRDMVRTFAACLNGM